jgi:hypothetical protein
LLARIICADQPVDFHSAAAGVTGAGAQVRPKAAPMLASCNSGDGRAGNFRLKRELAKLEPSLKSSVDQTVGLSQEAPSSHWPASSERRKNNWRFAARFDHDRGAVT